MPKRRSSNLTTTAPQPKGQRGLSSKLAPWAVGLAWFVYSCSFAPAPKTPFKGDVAAQASSLHGVVPGISGMVHMEGTHYLVVHDTKSHQEGPRFGVVTVDTEEGLRYRAVEVDNWRDPDGRSSDLEDVCALGPREFLAVESGSFEGRFGRLFHLQLANHDPTIGTILGAASLPRLVDNSRSERGDNYEGLACLKAASGQVIVLLGERGDSAAYPESVLRWGLYDPSLGTLEFTAEGFAGRVVEAPLPGPNVRSIAALHVDSTNTLWASADKDPGDLGPFRSVLYRLGRVLPEQDPPFRLEVDIQPRCRVNGYKVEGLSSSHVALSNLSIGSEDELLGGSWRALDCTPATVEHP